MTKINNYILFLLAMGIPFITTFKNFLKYLSFVNISFFLIFYLIIYLFVTNTKPSLKLGKITSTLIMYFVAQCISAVLAYDTDLSMAKLFQEFQFLIAFIAINGLIVHNDAYKFIFTGILIGFALSVIIAALQYLEIKQFYLFTPEELNGNAGLVKENMSRVLRIWGPYGNSLSFGEYLSLTGIALYSYFRMAKRRNFAAFCILVAAIFSVYLTVSRTAIFSLVISLIVVEFIYKLGQTSKKPIFALAGSLIIVAAIFLLAPGIQENGNPLISRFSNMSQDLKVGRLNLWIKGFDAFLHDVFFGVGPGNLSLALSAQGYPLTSVVTSNFDGQHVENYYLTVLYTYGVVGFFFFIRLCYLLLSYSYQLFLLLRGKMRTSAYGGALFPAVLVFLICNITIPALVSEQRTKLLFIFLIAIINKSFLTFDKVQFFKTSSSLRSLFTKK